MVLVTEVKLRFLSTFLFAALLFAESGQCQFLSKETREDSIRVERQRRGAGGIEAGHAWRSDKFSGFFFRVFYEAQVGKTFLNAGAFSYQKINDGFGFDFRLRMPWI